MKKQTKKKIGFVLGVTATVIGSIKIGWYLKLFTESKIPFSYRTDFIIFDTLSALGLRNYNP